MRDFRKNFFRLYFVFVLQNVLTLCVNLADNMMLGAYSEAALSGASAVNQVQFVYQQLLMALGECAVMFGSQYWGEGRIEPIKKVGSIVMRTGIALAVLLFVGVSIFPTQVMRLFTSDLQIISEGSKYLGIIRFTYLFFAVSVILLATLRSVEIVKIGFWLSIISLVTNIIGNYILIYGKFGAPRLGIEGAAISTLIARVLEVVLLLLFLWKKEKILNIRLSDYKSFDMALARAYAKPVTPMLLIALFWGLATAMQTIVMGHMSSVAIAANSVASTMFLLVKSASFGASQASSVVIGKAIGAGDMNYVKLCAKRLQRIFTVIALIGGFFLFIIRIPVLGLYHLSPETRQMADAFLVVLSIIFVGMGYQMPTSEGIIRGGGNPNFVVKMNIISSWLIVLPLSFIMAFVVKASPVVVVFCLNADQIFKCVPVFIKANFGKWIVKLTDN